MDLRFSMEKFFCVSVKWCYYPLFYRDIIVLNTTEKRILKEINIFYDRIGSI